MNQKTFLNLSFLVLFLIAVAAVYVGWQSSIEVGTEAASKVTTFYSSRHTWEKAYGGSHTERAHDIVALSNRESFVTAGLTRSFGHGFMSAHLIKLNTDGEVQWDRAFGTDEMNAANDMVKTKGGNVMVAGFAQADRSKGTETGDMYLLNVSSDGRKLWDRTYGGEGREGATSITHAPDGGFLLTGRTESYGEGGKNMYVLRVGPDGRKLWDRTFDQQGDSTAICSVSTGNGEYIVGGTTTVQPKDNRKGRYVSLIRIDDNGNTVWRKLFGLDRPDQSQAKPINMPNAIVAVGTGHFIVAGWTNQAARKTGYLLKIDQRGELIWGRRMRPHTKNALFDVRTFQDGFLAVGKKHFQGSSGNDGYVVKFDKDGEQEWFRTYGQRSDTFNGREEMFHSIAFGSNNEIYVAGENDMRPKTEQAEDVYVLKLNQNGQLKTGSERSDSEAD